jgi:cobalt-zinc-cadmium efflux system outer membrane protein
MRELIGLSSESLPEMAGEIVVQDLPQTLGQLSSRALTERPDLLAARTEVERNRAQLALQRAESVPNVVGFVRYSYDRLAFDASGFDASGRLVPIEDSSHGVSLGINFDLPFRDRNQGSIAEALARIRSQEFRVSSLEASVRREVATAFERYRATRDTLRSLDADVLKQSRDTLDALGQAYRLGEIPFSEVLVEQRRVIDFELSYNDVMKEYVSAAVELAGAAGMLGRGR